jgi:hypothetical protein
MTVPPPTTPPAEPIERWVPLALRCIPLSLCTWMLVQAADATWSFPPGRFPLLFGQWYVWIITPLHEAGHLILMPFGRIPMIAGGSFWQVAIPLILAAVAFRQRSYWAWVYVALAGIHLIALNPYIYDAPYRSLRLLGGRKEGHDWHNLLIHWQALDAAEDLAMLAYVGGIVVSAVGLAGGVVWSVIHALPPRAPVIKMFSRTR